MLQSIQQGYKHYKFIIIQYTDSCKCVISSNIDPDYATVSQYNIKESHLHGEVFHIEYVDLHVFIIHVHTYTHLYSQIFTNGSLDIVSKQNAIDPSPVVIQVVFKSTNLASTITAR
jgi:hypothetical protein